MTSRPFPGVTYRPVPDGADSAGQVSGLSDDSSDVEWGALRFKLWFDAAEASRVSKVLEHAWKEKDGWLKRESTTRNALFL